MEGGWPRRSDGRGLSWTQRQRNQVHYTANGTGRRVWSATSSSKVGTVCVSSASTGLCGGQWATAVPRDRGPPLDPLGERSSPLEFLHARDLLRRGAREIDMMLNIARLRSRQFQYIETEILQMGRNLPK